MCVCEYEVGVEVDMLIVVVFLLGEDNEVRKGIIIVIEKEGSDDRRME